MSVLKSPKIRHWLMSAFGQKQTLDSLQMNNVKMVLTIVSQIALNKITDSVIRLLLVLRLYNISLVDRAPLLFR